MARKIIILVNLFFLWSRTLCEKTPDDCSAVQTGVSGVYSIQPADSPHAFSVYCDFNLDNKRWTMIHNRFRTRDSLNFAQSYQKYVKGFGFPCGDHWLGLEHIHLLTKDLNHELYVDLKFMNGRRAFAHYSTFIVKDHGSGYRITVSEFSGTAGDGLGMNNGYPFSTYDHDKDGRNEGEEKNCAKLRGGGWWYSNCTLSNLNGKFNSTSWDSVYWRIKEKPLFGGSYYWTGPDTLMAVRMLTRRSDNK